MEKPKIHYLWRIAALILLISIVVLLFRRSSLKHAPAIIYEQHFQPYEAPTNLRGAELQEMDDDFMLAMIKYDENSYAEALALFEKAYEKDRENFTARFLMAVSYMALKDFYNAEPIFKELAEDSAHVFQDQARWYLGLLYLSDSDKSNDHQAADILDKIKTPSLKNKAMQLLEL